MSAHLDKQLHLRKNEDRRIRGGHPWVFSNEIREIKGTPVAGDLVEVLSAGGLTLGVGFYNPHSLIAFRMLSHTVEPVDSSFFHRRIENALALRSRIYPGEHAYRLVHGEGDFLPGLVIDRYGSIISLQTFSSGMDIRLPVICDVLQTLLGPEAIIERNESPTRALEHLDARRGTLRGAPRTVTLEEHGIRYLVDPLEGQKTGFFLDQRENRKTVRPFCAGKRVLDCFCNDGGFALNAAAAGASEVLGIDISPDAVRRADHNASANGYSGLTFRVGDVFEELERLGAEGQTFDVVVLDPPSFTRNRKTVPAARKGYRDLHLSAMRLLPPGGILATASCSHHIEPASFLQDIQASALRSGRGLQLLDWRGAAPDHPSLPSVPETQYLKFALCTLV